MEEPSARVRGRVSLVAGGATLALVLGGAGLWAAPAQAVAGDTATATGQYLSGSLLGSDLALIASLGGEAAASTGTADQTNANNLDVGALGLVALTAPGGIQLPLNLNGVGAVSQYASALHSASSVGASGLTSVSGDIGTGILPAPGVAPGPLHLDLAQAVSALGLPSATLDQVAQLDLKVGVTAARAAQVAPGPATGSYSLADVGVQFQSPTIAGVAATINTQVGTIQSLVNGLAGPTGTLNTAVNTLGLGLLTTDASVDASNLQATIAPLLTGPITDPAHPGVSIDLSTGSVTVDLGQLTALEGLAPNTNLLTPAVITAIGDAVTGVVGSLLARVTATLTNTIDALGIHLSASLLGIPVITVDETVGALLSGDTSGITLLGVALGLPLGTVLGALLSPLTAIGTTISALGPAVVAPVVDILVPALQPVLSQVVALTVNNQSSSGGVFRETALRASVLPAASALTLDVANATVGPNALAVAPTATSLSPTSGPEAGGTQVVVTGTGFAGATGVTFGGIPGTSFTVIDDATIVVTTPPHTPAAVPVVVQHPAGDAPPLTFTFLAAPTVTGVAPTSGPEAGGTVVTISGTGFTGATAVDFGSAPAASFTVVSDTTITATTPAHAPGPVPVTVAAPGGTSTPGTFTFLAAPTISGITPDHGPETGGTVVTITGTGFTGATAVTFDGNAGTALTVVNDTTITVTTPAGVAGPADVVVHHPDGDSGPGIFTYDPVAGAATISGLAPDHGPTSGGTTVTITGTGFLNARSVTVDDAARPFTVVDDATITIVTAAHAVGGVPVVVTTGSGASAPATYTYVDAPTHGGGSNGAAAASNTGGGKLADTGWEGGGAVTLALLAMLLLGSGVTLVLRRRRQA